MRNIISKIFFTLLALTLGFGQMWADPTGVSAGTYELSSTYKPGSNKRFKSIGTGIYLHRVNNSSWSSDYGMKLKDNQNGVAFYISSAMDVTFRYYKNSNSKAETTTFSVYTISSSDYALFTGGTENSTNVELSLGSASATKTIELEASYKDYKVTDAISLSAGYYYIVGKDDTSNGTTYWTSLTLASSCSCSITTQPTGATLAIGDANPELSIVATHADSYAWKESSNGTSKDGAVTLGTNATFTPEVNDAVQTKYYYCEVTSDCDGSTVVSSNIVTVNVVGAISYYTVTLNPAGGTIVDATGWTLNAGNYEKEVAEGTVLTLPTFTKENRNFKTWRKAGPADVASPVTVNADLDLTAIWTATVENVIYSWEGAEGGAIETGGTAAGNADNLINQVSAGYYCLKIDGNNSYSRNLVTITLDGTEKVKTGDKIKYWGFYNKSSNANARPKMRDANGSNASIFDDPNNLPNLYSGGDQAERTFTVPAGINTSAVQITRSQTGSNTWISKLQIIREVQVEEADLLTVTFDANGGSAVASAVVASGQTVAKPADPTWAKHRFNEWQLAGSAYDFSSAVTTDITLVANWTQLYTISFANGGGSGDAPAAIADKAQGETFQVPANTFTAPSASQEFDIWNDGTNDYAPGATYTVGTENVILTAQWKALVAKYTVIFKDGETTLDTKLVDVGSNPSDAGVDKTKALSTFAAWQKDAADIALDDAFWATVAANAEITLTARWTKAYATDVDFETEAVGHAGDEDYAKSIVDAHNYALSTKTGTTFDENTSTNNGAYLGLKIKNSGTTLSWNVVAGKVVELKAGVMVANGSLTVNGGAATTIDGGSTSSGDNFKMHYFYSATEALYVFTTSNGSVEVIKAITMRDPYTVSFDVNGGDDPIADMTAMPSITLPTPTKGSESFLGWFDALDNFIGNAGDTYAPEATIELVAHWESVSTDARLSEITFSAAGTLSPAFDPEVVNYTYTMPYGTAAVPTITGATAVNANAQAPVIDAQAAAWNETAIIRGVAQSGDSKAYNITMEMAPKDGVSIIKVETTGGTNKTVTGLYAGDGDVSLSSSKKMDNGKYIGFILDGTTLQAGDRINVHTTTAANTGGSHIIFYDNMTDKNELYETGEIGGLGDNIFTINAAMVGQVSAYVYRSNADAAHQWNGYVDFIEVTRAINPILTAITINGEAGVIDESLKTVNVELQPGYDLAALTIVPTIVSNTDEALVVKTVESNGGAWVLGDNTYRLTDKDGDYTEYTITLSVGEVKHTVTFDAQGGTAVDPQQVVDGGNPVVPTAPTKDDYIFQGWSETTDGAVVDVTSFTITAPKTFYAIWASDGAIKLLDGSTVNHTNFITGVTASTVEIESVDYNCVATAGNTSAVNNSSTKNHDRVIAYNATTTQTKIQLSLYNSNGNARSIEVKGVVEGTTDIVDLGTINLTGNEKKVTEYIEFNNAKNRTIYIYTTSNAGHIKILQVKVLETGTALPMAGDAGYSFNLNQGRLFGKQLDAFNFEGLDIEYLAADYTPLSTSVGRFALGTSISFDVTSDVTMSLTAANNKTYYVTKDAAGTDNETSKTGVSEFALTAGTWYITAGAEDMQFTNIAFSAPKCAEPSFASLTNSDICAGDPYVALNGTATVADAGVPTYQWYNADGDVELVGETNATYTPSADGSYYVIATNHLAGFADNAKQSATVTVTTFASANIISAPLNQRGTAGNDATLTVAATGKNLSYQWFTCDNEAGDNPTVMAGEENASLTVTIPSGTQWYKVVVSSDCGNVEATAKVEEFVPATPQNVTESTTWDWKSTTAGFPTENSSIDFANTSVEELLANVSSLMPNNDAFHSDMLYGIGQRAWRKSSNDGECGFQGFQLRFHTEVAGRVRVYFRAPSSGQTSVVRINDNEAGSRGNSWGWSQYVFVDANTDVVIAMTNGETGMTRVQKLEFQTPDYTRTDMLGNGVLGTLCIDHNVPVEGIQGATFYELVGREPVYGKIAFDQITTGQLDAGVPYVFQANGDKLALYYGNETVGAPVNSNGMYGTFTDVTLTELDDVYYFAQKALWSCTDLTSLSIPANRAYVKLSEIPSAMAPAPGRIRMTLNVNGAPQVTTGMEEITNDQSQMANKVIIDGRLFILRGEKLYDATGRLVK